MLKIESPDNLHDRRFWVFDLDQTLYPFNAGLIRQMDERIGLYCQNFFKTDLVAAHHVRKKFLDEHGATLGGLLKETGFDAADYLAFVHDVDYSELAPCARLRAALSALPGKKYIYTNADRAHAERTLEKRGLTGLFEDIHDITASNYNGKPCPTAFQDFLEKYAVAPAQTVFFDDKPINVNTALAAGAAGYIVREAVDPRECPLASNKLTVYNLAEFLEKAVLHGANKKEKIS